jgi:hypothetical protein
MERCTMPATDGKEVLHYHADVVDSEKVSNATLNANHNFPHLQICNAALHVTHLSRAGLSDTTLASSLSQS